MTILSNKNSTLQDKISNAPQNPGCYIYLNEKNEIIYVGKAKNIKNRVKSYFTNYKKLDPKIQAMIDLAQDINFITVDSEVEALILETNLIKKYLPKYNTLLKDDKNYIYVMIESVIKGVRDYPKIKIVRQIEDTKAIYFGPYPDSFPAKNVLKKLRRVFPYVSCNRRLIQVSIDPLVVDTNNKVPCLYYHIGLCNAPCASLQTKADYAKNLKSIIKFFNGEKNEIVVEMEKIMAEYSEQKNYEEAAKIRDKINEIKYVTQSIKIGNDVDDIVINELKKKQRAEAINQLIAELDFPKEKLSNHKDFKIECYDISNIQGTNAVGAMTVMIDGELRPDLYRKFRIQRKNTPNDFAMLQEVFSRRFSHLTLPSAQPADSDPSFSIMPDLIIVDGGKGQLGATFQIMKNLGLDKVVPIVGLAKREEEIFKVQWQFNVEDWPDLALKRFKRIFLPRGTEALYLVQRIRDEAHRFGINYHRKLRSKKMII